MCLRARVNSVRSLWLGMVCGSSAHMRGRCIVLCVAAGKTARANHKSTLVLASLNTFQQPCHSRSRLLSLRLPWRNGPRTAQARRRRPNCRPYQIWSRWKQPRSARVLSDSLLSDHSILSFSRPDRPLSLPLRVSELSFVSGLTSVMCCQYWLIGR